MIQRIVYLAVFLSGFASLGYELCWIRKGTLLIGATPQALSIVVAVFFGGMATGAWLFGLFSRRTDNALLWYGALEIVIGLMAAITPVLFELSGGTAALIYDRAGENQSLLVVLRSGLVAALIFPACVLIGGTLPLLCRFLISNRHADIRSTAGMLYAINTAGAFLGCMVCGIWLIQFWGVDGTISFNALLSVSVGIAVVFVSRAVSPLPASTVLAYPTTYQPSGTVTETKNAGLVLYVLFFCTGFAALGYELVWVRFLSLIIHNTVYTTVFALGVILLGIAIGGWLTTVFNNRPDLDLLVFAAVNCIIGFSVLVTLLLPFGAWEWIRGTQSLPLQAMLCLVIMLIPSIASGISFPVAYRLVASTPINSGREFGFLTAVNTVGGISGSVLVGFLLLPEAGIYASVLVLTCVSLLIGIGALCVFADDVTWLLKKRISYGIVLVLFGILLFGRVKLPADFLADKRMLIEYAEGISSFIAVIRHDGDNKLEIDRMWQGSNQKGHQIMAAHIPMMLHQDPRRVLVIGMGTGQTASRFLMYAIERLDCVEIEKKLPGILRRHFDAAWLSDPRTRFVTDDGRNFTAYTKAIYDIISIEVGQSFRPQVASFYTVNFYRDVKKRLTKDGLASQFVPVGFFTENEFRSLVRSFLEVFPLSTLWFNKYGECILVGNATDQPLLSSTRLALLQSDPVLRADLNYSFDGSPWFLMNQKEVFAANYLMGPQTLARLSAEAPLYFDDKPVLEYQAAHNRYSQVRFHQLIEKNLDSPDTIFDHAISIASEAKIIQIREETVHGALKETK